MTIIPIGCTVQVEKIPDRMTWLLDGLQVSEVYFKRQDHKNQAISNIINIENPVAFAKESGYLKKY